MQVRRVLVVVLDAVVPMPMRVLAENLRLVPVHVLTVVLPMRVLVFELFVNVSVPVMLGEVEIDADPKGNGGEGGAGESTVAERRRACDPSGMAFVEKYRLLVESMTMLLAAALEVGGDALIRAGLRSKGLVLVVGGFVVLGSYGVVVNLLPMDFSKLLGTYVAFFAVVSVLFGRIVFGDVVPTSTWLGLAVIMVGSAIIQAGRF